MNIYICKYNYAHSRAHFGKYVGVHVALGMCVCIYMYIYIYDI